ncbi:MAG: DUF2071 domain-containing protein [Pirellulaceae bacterium]|nr:DUF2071 domain-containing protein [Pirellulaceae bacterium]
MKNIREIAASSDRQWPLPDRNWSVRMKWHDLLFAHWPVPAERIQSTLPPGLMVDTYDAKAWVGVVPFRMTDVVPRGAFAVPWLSAFLELNVRTYVTFGGQKPGVWFYSLDAANPIAVRIARWRFNLPYMNSSMKLERDGETIDYRSTRTHRNEPSADFFGTYRPVGKGYLAKPGSMEFWLTARYCMYSQDRQQNVYCGEILHPPWELQAAQCEIQQNTMLDPLGISTDTQPILHYAHYTDVVAWSNDLVQ